MKILIQGGTSIYLLTSDVIKPQWSTTRKVELLKDHIYCLAPSAATDTGFVTLYSEIPAFVHDIPSHVFIAKVLKKE